LEVATNEKEARLRFRVDSSPIWGVKNHWLDRCEI